MQVLKESDGERVVVIPLTTGPSGMVKYQVQRRFGTGSSYETVTEFIIDMQAGTPARNMISLSNLKMIMDDAQQRSI